MMPRDWIPWLPFIAFTGSMLGLVIGCWLFLGPLDNDDEDQS